LRATPVQINMITVSIYKQSNYPISSKKVKDIIKKTLLDNGIISDTTVDVAIVGKAKMDELNKKYYKDEKYEHPIFTFPEISGDDFSFPPDGKIHLGQIVISYPMAISAANEKGKLIDEVVCELAEHGSLHLLGIHH
jgi:rRNA maturation RNase YbeY